MMPQFRKTNWINMRKVQTFSTTVCLHSKFRFGSTKTV